MSADVFLVLVDKNFCWSDLLADKEAHRKSCDCQCRQRIVTCVYNRKAVRQTVIQVRRRILPSVSRHCSSSSSSSSRVSSDAVISRKQSDAARSMYVDPACSGDYQRQSCRQAALSGQPRSQPTDSDDVAGRLTHHGDGSRSLSHLRPRSSDLRLARDRGVDLVHFVQVREALEPIRESSEQSSELDVGGRDGCGRLSGTRRWKFTAGDAEVDKENFRRVLSLGSDSIRTTTREANKPLGVGSEPRHQRTTSLQPSRSAASVLLNPAGRAAEDGGDKLEPPGDVTSSESSSSSSCGRALMPVGCTTMSADEDDAKAGDTEGAVRHVQRSAEFRRGLARRSFSLPRLKTKFSLKVTLSLRLIFSPRASCDYRKYLTVIP